MKSKIKQTVVKIVAPNEWNKLRSIRLTALQTNPDAFGGVYKNESEEPDSYWIDKLSDAKKTKVLCNRN